MQHLALLLPPHRPPTCAKVPGGRGQQQQHPATRAGWAHEESAPVAIGAVDALPLQPRDRIALGSPAAFGVE